MFRSIIFFVILIAVSHAEKATRAFVITGTCNQQSVCDVDLKYADPNSKTEGCTGGPGKFSGSGINGRTSCTPPGTKCSYLWSCL